MLKSFQGILMMMLVAILLLAAPAALAEAGLIMAEATGAPQQAVPGLLFDELNSSETIELLSDELYVQAAAAAPTPAPFDDTGANRANRIINGWKGWGYVVYNFAELRTQILNPRMGTNVWFDGNSNVMRLYLGYYPVAGYSGEGATRTSAFSSSGATITMPAAAVRDGSMGYYNASFGLGFTKVEIVGTDPYEVTNANNRSMDKSYWQTVTWNSSNYMITCGNATGQYIALQHGFYKSEGAGGLGTRTGTRQTTMEMYNAVFEGGILFNNPTYTGSSHNTIIHNSEIYWTRQTSFCIRTSNNLRINWWAGAAHTYFESQVPGSMVVFDNTTTNTVEVADILNGNSANFLELNLCAGSSFIQPAADYITDMTFSRSTGFLMNGNGLLSSRALRGITLGTYLGSNPSFTINPPASGTHDTITNGFAFLHVNTTFSIASGWDVDINYRAKSDSNRSAFRLGTAGTLTIPGGSTMRVSHIGGVPMATTNSGGALSVGGGRITLNTGGANLFVHFEPDGGTGHGIYATHATNGLLIANAGSTIEVTQRGGGSGAAIYTTGTTSPSMNISGALNVYQDGGTGNAIYSSRQLTIGAAGSVAVYRTPTNAATPAVDTYGSSVSGRLIIEDSGNPYPALRTRSTNTFAAGSRVSISNPSGSLIASDSATARQLSISANALTLYTNAQTYIWNNAALSSVTVSAGVTTSGTTVSSPSSIVTQDPLTPQNFSALNLASNASNRLETGTVQSLGITTPLLRGNGQRTVLGTGAPTTSTHPIRGFFQATASEFVLTNATPTGVRQSSGAVPLAHQHGSQAFTITMPSPLSDVQSAVLVTLNVDHLQYAKIVTTTGQVALVIPSDVVFEYLNALPSNQLAKRHQGDSSAVPPIADYTSWPITVIDTRPYYGGSGSWVASPFRLSAQMRSRFQTTGGKTMQNSRVLWVENAGTAGTPLGLMPGESAATIIPSRSMAANTYSYTVDKGIDEGLIFSYIAGEADAGDEFTATLVWTVSY